MSAATVSACGLNLKPVLFASVGGVACLDTGVRMTMSGCTVTNNQAPWGGALGLAGLEGAEVIMANASVFAFNTARAGGVAHLSDGSTISGDSMRAANNSAIRYRSFCLCLSPHNLRVFVMQRWCVLCGWGLPVTNLR